MTSHHPHLHTHTPYTLIAHAMGRGAQKHQALTINTNTHLNLLLITTVRLHLQSPSIFFLEYPHDRRVYHGQYSTVWEDLKYSLLSLSIPRNHELIRVTVVSPRISSA